MPGGVDGAAGAGAVGSIDLSISRRYSGNSQPASRITLQLKSNSASRAALNESFLNTSHTMARDPDDCVSRDAVWTEYIRKELATMQLTTEFTANTRTSTALCCCCCG